MQSNEEKQAEKRMTEMVASANLKQFEKNCDGNFLFEAMSQLLFGFVGFHGKIREWAVTFIDDNRSMFEDAVVVIATTGHERGKRTGTDKMMIECQRTTLIQNRISTVTLKHANTWGDCICIDAIAMVYDLHVTLRVASLLQDGIQWECN